MYFKLKRKIKEIVQEITLEPILFLFMLAIGCSDVISDNLLIHRVCRVSFEFNETICKNLTAHEDLEKQVQGVVAMYSTAATAISSALPILYVMFLGSYVDKFGSKAPTLCSICGYIGWAFLNMTFALVPNVHPALILLSSVSISLGGGVPSFLMSILSFISKRTEEKNRSFRIAVLESGWFISYPCGLQLGSLIFTNWGFPPVFGSSAAILCCSFILTILVMKEELEKPKNETCCNARQLFKIDSLKESFTTCLKKRPNHHRRYILILMSMIGMRILAQEGTQNCRYLYTRNKFGWDSVEYSHFTSIEVLMRFAGLVTMATLLKKFHLRDTPVGLFSSFGYIISHCVFAFATAGWMMYLGGAIKMLCTLIVILIRSITSKLVDKDELGKVFSCLAIMEACTPLVSGTIFNTIYKFTLSSFPGVIFLVAAFLHVVIFVQFIYLSISMNVSDPEDRKKNVEVNIDEQAMCCTNL